jgi:hypothetical protein
MNIYLDIKVEYPVDKPSLKGGNLNISLGYPGYAGEMGIDLDINNENPEDEPSP